jgi:acyl-CoA synthetase (AMP-forming)/AMP-acid ligase II
MRRSAPPLLCAKKSSTLPWPWRERGTTRRSTASRSPRGSSSNTSWLTRCLPSLPLLSPRAQVVFAKVREALGGRLQYIGSGGAATTLKVIQFFEDIGIPILEGYGLTETSPVIAACKPPSPLHELIRLLPLSSLCVSLCVSLSPLSLSPSLPSL